MKYLKTFENINISNMEYLNRYKKYILLIYPDNSKYIVENLGNQFKKLYSDEGFASCGDFEPFREAFYFSLTPEKLEKVFAYDSDSIEGIFENLEFILKEREMINTANKYNI